MSTNPLSHQELVHHLHQASHDPYLSAPFRQALSQALTAVEQTYKALKQVAGGDFLTWYELAKATGLLKEYAKEHLTYYGHYLLVSDIYDEEDDFALALRSLIGPYFEYPDWSHKTVGEVLEAFK